MRRSTTSVSIGHCTIGGTAPISVQSMCNTPTADIDASIAQCIRLHVAGADLIRLTTQNLKEVEALSQIKARLRAQGIPTPLIADVHFSPQVAHAAATVADKVRINPGNFAKNPEQGKASFMKLLELCHRHHTALRIGVNHGSLNEETLSRFGNTPQGMSHLAMQWLHLCKEASFDQVVVSMKSSNPRIMVAACRQLVSDMDAANMRFPLHLGVTEAGNGREARMKSAIALSTLLRQGIGDTIRISLTEPPEHEISFAHSLLSHLSTLPPLSPPYLSTPPSPLPPLPPLLASPILPDSPSSNVPPSTFNYQLPTPEALLLSSSCQIGPLLLDGFINDISISAQINGAPLPLTEISDFTADLLQAARVRFSKPEYIACPGCGRTLFDIEKTLQEIKAHTTHLKGISIAVMGCIVNGPGEMADAQYGYVGAGIGKVTLYRGQTPILHAIPQEDAVPALLKLIENEISYISPKNI